MKQIRINDMTLVQESAGLSFKDKIEIARHLDNLKVDVIDMPEIVNPTTDALLIRTVAAFIKNSTVSVTAGADTESLDAACAAISNAKKARIKINIPTSPVQMEYICHKKPLKLLAAAEEVFRRAVEKCGNVEFYAADATRADRSFLNSIIKAATDAGVGTITLCDDEGVMMPDEFTAFINSVTEDNPSLQGVNLGVLCRNTNGMAQASAVMSVKSGVSEIRCCVDSSELPRTDMIANVINRCGDKLGISSDVNCNELLRITKQIEWIIGKNRTEYIHGDKSGENYASLLETNLDVNDSIETVTDSVKKLGYDLSDEDYSKVYDEFRRVASKKNIGNRELEAVIASVAMQVPPTYKLVSYVINNGNIISASAHIKLEKDGREINGICIGDGPVDASFRAVEQIIGYHYELDDFQIQSVTEGREAMGSAVVRLRSNGKIYSGNGISTDIIGSSIRAYINAINKIVYEEHGAKNQ